jgi:hypothetical protein
VPSPENPFTLLLKQLTESSGSREETLKQLSETVVQFLPQFASHDDAGATRSLLNAL